MPCYSPLKAFQPAKGGKLFFVEEYWHAHPHGADARIVRVPCGQCIGCRLERSRQWAVRCLNEAAMHDRNCFITLTYDPKFMTESGSLRYRDFQLFCKRLRKKVGSFRFMMCGEYGGDRGRPHFHAILFGIDFADRQFLSKPNGFDIFTSEILQSCWQLGFSSVGDMTFETAAYVARYCCKKVTGRRAVEHYEVIHPLTGEVSVLVPEFGHMSTRPGIGAKWIDSFYSDVFPHGKIVVNGVECPPPRFYMKRFAERDPVAAEALKIARTMEDTPASRERDADNVPSRLKVREVVAKARAALKKRS